MDAVTINLVVKGKKTELTLAEAREIYNELGRILGRDYLPVYPTLPIIIDREPHVIPPYPNPLTPWCGDSIHPTTTCRADDDFGPVASCRF